MRDLAAAVSERLGGFECCARQGLGERATTLGKSVFDARQKILCDNAKAANIVIYTVQVNTGGDPTSTVLQYCASGPQNFFVVTTASQTAAVFSSIGTSLSKLRVAK